MSNPREDDPQSSWQRNRSGECALCGIPLDHYATKWVEKHGERIVCIYGPPYGCGARDLGRGARQGWWYYTDG